MLGRLAFRLIADWFVPPCPVDTHTKTWVERRMRWLADRFGPDRLRTVAVVLPTDEFFPDRYTPDEDGCRGCLLRMCGYMGVPPESVHLQIVDDEHMPDAAGLYQMRERSVICLARSQLADPMRLMATVAHELAHELLMKGGHLTGDEADHEQVTDLLPVFLGTGIFAANATLKTKAWSEGRMEYWSYSRQGYLSSIELGYALAVFAHFRGEERPPWAKHLRADAAVTLRDGLRYLRQTGNTLFHPDTYQRRTAAPTVTELGTQLAHTSATVRLNALWDLAECPDPPPDLMAAVERCLEDSNPTVQVNAVAVLGRYGASASGAIPQLIEAAYHGETGAMRAAAASTLGQIGTDAEQVVPALTAVLRDAETAVVCAAAGALARYSRAAEQAEPKLLDVLEAAAYVNAQDRIGHAVAALRAIHPDAGVRIRDHFAEADAEVRRHALAELIRQERGE